MPKVLLCAEGKKDHGREEYRRAEGGYVRKDGVLQVLMQKCADGMKLSFTVKTRSDIRKAVKTSRSSGNQDTFARKLAVVAKQVGCRHVAYHCDEDDEGFDKKHGEAETHLSAAREGGMKCIGIVPMHMTESWLLADEGAFPDKPTKPALPRKPEETWGNPESEKHPKKYLERVLAQFHIKVEPETMAEIAKNINIKVLEEKCPISFGRFCKDMKNFIGE